MFPSLVVDSGFPTFTGATIAKWAPLKGLSAVVIDEIGIHLIDTIFGREKMMIVRSRVSAIEYSPRDTFFVTCEKYVNGEKNLVIWNSMTGKEVWACEFKKISKEGPKSIKFTTNESHCARLSSKNTIDIYEL